MKPLRIEVIMATFNNAAYVGEMLQSLLRQTHSDFHLIISDDQSQDDTLRIIQEYIPGFHNEVTVFRRETNSGSAKANFSFMMEQARGDYVLFADADDIWDPNKVGLTLRLLQEAEARWGNDLPIYAFSDVRVIDGSGRLIYDSYWKMKKIDPNIANRLNQVLVCPPMLGCASGINRALLKIATPVPYEDVTGHDWWALLVAATFGRVVYRSDTTMSYRVHGENSSAPKTVSAASYLRAPRKVAKVRRGMMLRRLQAKALLDRFAHHLPGEKRRQIERFIATARQGFFARRATLLMGRYLYPDWPRNVAMMIAA